MNSHIVEKLVVSVLKEASGNLKDVGVDYRLRGLNFWDRVVAVNGLGYLKKNIRYFLIRERTAKRFAELCIGVNIHVPLINSFIRDDLKMMADYEQYVLDNGHSPPIFDIGDRVVYYDYIDSKTCYGKVLGMIRIGRGNKFYNVDTALTDVPETAMNYVGEERMEFTDKVAS